MVTFSNLMTPNDAIYMGINTVVPRFLQSLCIPPDLLLYIYSGLGMGYVSLDPYTLFECFLAWPSLHPLEMFSLSFYIRTDTPSR